MKLCHVNENIASIEVMRSWINKARQFRANTEDAKKQDARKFGVMR